jgi:hypothetical protein
MEVKNNDLKFVDGWPVCEHCEGDVTAIYGKYAYIRICANGCYDVKTSAKKEENVTVATKEN